MLNQRVRLKLLQKEVAKEFGCTLEAYQLWESDNVVPRPRVYPKIIEFLGYLPGEDLSTYHGTLRSHRLRQGLTMIAMAKKAGANSAAWTRWERGIYVPALEFIRKLALIGIDLSHFDLHGDIVPTNLSKALRKARKEKGYTHQQMSEVLGYVSPAVWHRLELQGVIPREEHWLKIQQCLGVKVRDFVDDPNETFPK